MGDTLESVMNPELCDLHQEDRELYATIEAALNSGAKLPWQKCGFLKEFSDSTARRLRAAEDQKWDGMVLEVYAQTSADFAEDFVFTEGKFRTLLVLLSDRRAAIFPRVVAAAFSDALLSFVAEEEEERAHRYRSSSFWREYVESQTWAVAQVLKARVIANRS